jgi:hypothetical protein
VRCPEMVLKYPSAENDRGWAGTFPGGESASNGILAHRQVMGIKSVNRRINLL